MSRETMPQPIDETRVLRADSDMLYLHGLCGRRACRRARSCRGEPRACLTRYAPLVPEDAREGAQAMMVAACRQGFSFDELMDDARREVLALVAWTDAVTASYRARGRRRGKTAPLGQSADRHAGNRPPRPSPVPCAPQGRGRAAPRQAAECGAADVLGGTGLGIAAEICKRLIA